SGVCGGARAIEGCWVLDTKAMARIGPLDAERWTVRAQAGVNGQQLEDWLAERGFTLGHSPSSIACSTVGGWAAARSAGQFSSRYGVFEDMVVSAVAVSPGGGVVRLGEGGQGTDADLAMWLGSEGTLGVITELELRVWPTPQRRWLRGYRMPDLATAITAMRTLMQGELHPSVVRLYDPVDTRIGGKTRPKKERSGGSSGFVRRWLRRVDDLPAVHRRTLALPLALPGLLNRVFDGIASGCLLVVGWEGDEDVVGALSAEGARLLDGLGEDLGAEPGERWFASRHAVSYKLMPIFERGGFADTMEVACRWSDLQRTYDAVREAVSPTAVVMAHMSHVYPEGGSIYFSFAGRGDQQVYDRTWEAALRAVLGCGATTTHHHGVGSLKARAASEEVGPAVAGWRAAKASADPAGILSPGRLYVDVAPTEPPVAASPVPQDGLGHGPIGADLDARSEGGEPRWPVPSLPGLPRWQRESWQQPWIGVEGLVDGRPCRLGRGPRSAAGPDLRPWLAEHGATTATWGVATAGERWMGEARVEHPMRVARELLRSDLRPAVLGLREGALVVGFRGPAARRMAVLASDQVPGGLTEVPWRMLPVVEGPLERCADDDPAACHATASSAFRPVRRTP
ncbi:MAG: FAD-binding oxidoreductase, partial [Myxococcales bacterium]|nr:FAD-binding oxidoreductase [Myxococcales bacterium]